MSMGIAISTLHVRRSALIQATPTRVWQEFTSFERLAAWFGRGHQLETYEPRLGGRIQLSARIDDVESLFGGSILIFEPARELSFSNNWESDGWPVATLITLRLTALYDACHVELFHHGFERLGGDAGTELQGYEAGWDTRHLRALKTRVEAQATAGS
jgi:uncharacterized protein YndB with AHSA1/START domain